MLPADRLPAGSLWVAVPVYNNRATVREVVARCRALVPRVVVVDDGSSDADLTALLAGLDVVVLRHPVNQGKGAAILTASRFIEEQGGTFMVTVDADGQHFPADLAAFLPLLVEDDPAIIIGCRDFETPNVPKSSRFGRAFANFWLLVETGETVGDCQSGFRAYPVRYLNRLPFKGARYDFEAEVLARAAWAGLALRCVPIAVHYPKPGERVSSFRPFLDNLRLTRIHAMLVGRRLLPWPHHRLVPKKPRLDLALLRHPGQVLRLLLKENATPAGLALAAGVGMFLAVLPILFAHTLVILYVAIRFNLNKLVSLNVQHLAMPPLMPALCIELGYYFRHGRWLTDLSYATLFEQFPSRLYEWLLGSLLVAPVSGALVAAIMYAAAVTVRKLRSNDAG
jgi:glycosyltransferase involved in cell wall biosynthesis